MSSSSAYLYGGQRAVDRHATVRVLGEYGCTGTAISPHTVLTAAHCLGPSEESVLVEGYGSCFPASGSLRHPEYYKFSANGDLEARKADIALVFVDDYELPPPYVDAFYMGRVEAHNCVRTFLQGYGSDGEPGSWLNEGEFVVWEEEPKLVRYTGYTQESTCHGDSGGPLYAEMEDGSVKLAAVHVWHSRSDCTGYSTGIRPAYWRDWIYANAHW